jgi:hypothetical protein
MQLIPLKTVAGFAAGAALALGGASPALAATHHGKRHVKAHHTKRHTKASTSTSTSTGNGETPLTGATLSSAEAAAIAANPGATATGASTETDSSLSGAAYEVHIVQSDGTRAVVIEDSSFNVLATQAQTQSAGPRR